MRSAFGLSLHEEIHASHMITRPGKLKRIRRNDRLTIIRLFADEIARMSDIRIINIVVDKNNKPPNYDVFSIAWRTLVQRFENTLSAQNFPNSSSPDERGNDSSDNTNNKKLVRLIRQMHKYNPVPNQARFGLGYRNLAITSTIEDPNFRDSNHSYFVQGADLAAYTLQQEINPNRYIRKKGARGNHFNRLLPVLCTVASRSDPTRHRTWLQKTKRGVSRPRVEPLLG